MESDSAGDVFVIILLCNSEGQEGLHLPNSMAIVLIGQTGFSIWKTPFNSWVVCGTGVSDITLKGGGYFLCEGFIMIQSRAVRFICKITYIGTMSINTIILIALKLN